MKCLNPNCGKEAHSEEDTIICDHCGTAMSVEVYANWNKQDVKLTETNYRDRLDRMVAGLFADCYKNEEAIPGVVEMAMKYIDAIDKAIKERGN